jgi:hypothetical protein
MDFFDGSGNILVPKSVRPIIDYDETILGSKKGAKKQYRCGNLHIREYNEYYSLHVDIVDPREDPIGHLIKDAPEDLVSLILASSIGIKIGRSYYNKKKIENNKTGLKISKGLMSSVLTATATYMVSRYIYLRLKKQSNQIEVKDK